MEDEVKEDPIGPNEDPERPKETKSQWKTGWVKKASGKILVSYKDRYIEVARTEIVVYENEDLKTCLERVDLENYDECHELRSAFKKKNRLVLIRAAKSGNRVNDVKFQAPNQEEKEAWIKAFSDCINRAKNKIFDEVKVDETSNLEHVTRSRPKANRNRRPPTRIHMKEVASVSSEGILRLDLDTGDGSTPNGTHHMTTDGTESPKQAVKPPMPPTSKLSQVPEECPAAQSPEKALPAEDKPGSQKGLKPPMPPSKEAKPNAAWDGLPQDSTTENCLEKKVLKPPMPPSKEAKPTVSAEDQTQVFHPPVPPSKESKPSAPTGDQPPSNTSSEGGPEESSDAGVDTVPSPNKPPGGSTDHLAMDPQTRPPTLPSKDKKPSQTDVEEDAVETSGQKNENKEDDEVEGENEEGSDTTASVVEPSCVPVGAEDDMDSLSSQLISATTIEVKVIPPVNDHPEVTITTIEEDMPQNAMRRAQEEETVPCGGVDIRTNEEPLTMKSTQITVPVSVPTQEIIKKSPCPPGPPVKKKPVKPCPPTATAPHAHPSKSKNEAADVLIPTTLEEKLNRITSTSPAPLATTVPTAETDDQNVPFVVESKCEFPVVVLSLSDLEPDGSRSSSLSFHHSSKKRKVNEEEKSVDSGQHSDVDDDGSENGDTLAASTAALRGSLVALDTLMDESEDSETPDSLGLSLDKAEDPSSTPAITQDKPSNLRSTFLQATRYPLIPLKPSSKLQSTSLGNLLSDQQLDEGVKHSITHVAGRKHGDPRDDVTDLTKEVALELEKTGELLGSIVSRESTEVGQGMDLEESLPAELLSRAMDQLRKADQFLKKARNMKESQHRENMTKRTSW